MTTELYLLMSRNEEEVIEKVIKRLKSSTAPHYLEIDMDLLKSRAARFVEMFNISLDADPGAFVNYVREIAEERITEGYSLVEIQCALNILEETAWQTVAALAPPLDQVRFLSRISGTISAAKDILARVYCMHMEAAVAEVQRLEAENGGPPESADELP